MPSLPTRPEAPLERWSRRFVLTALVVACVGWYVGVVRPNDAKMFAVMACVGDRAPTEHAIKSCAKQVQP